MNKITSSRNRALIVVVIATAIVYIPVLYGLKDAFFYNGVPSLENIAYVLSKDSIQYSLRFTFIQALLSSLIAVVIGSITAFTLLLIGSRRAALLRALSIVPFMSPPMVVVTGFTALYGVHGIVSSIIPQAKILGYGFWAIIAAHVFYNIPLAINFVYSSLVSIPRSLLDTVRMYGFGNASFMVRKVVIPYILPAIASAFTLTFIYCFTSFAIPLTLGGVKYSTLEVYIYYYYKIVFEPEKAAAIAFIQYIILLAIVSIFIYFHGKTFAAPIGYRHYRFQLRSGYRILLLIILGTVYAYLYAPLLAIAYYAFYDPYTGSLTLSGFSKILAFTYDPGLGVNIGVVYVNTLYYALMTGLLSIVLSTIIVYYGGRVVDTLYASLLAVSPLTLSLGLMRAYSLYIPNAFLIILAHTIASLPLTTRVLRIGFERINRRFIEAAYMLGEHGLPLHFRVIYPLMKPSYLVALSLALVVSLGEFGATLFISTPETITLGIAVYRYRGLREWTASAASASILLLLTGAILVILSRRMERWL